MLQWLLYSGIPWCVWIQKARPSSAQMSHITFRYCNLGGSVFGCIGAVRSSLWPIRSAIELLILSTLIVVTWLLSLLAQVPLDTAGTAGQLLKHNLTPRPQSRLILLVLYM